MTSHEPSTAPHGAVGGGRYLPFRYGTFGDLRPGDRWIIETLINGRVGFVTICAVEVMRVEDRGRGDVLIRGIKEDGESLVPLAYTRESGVAARILVSELHATHVVDTHEGQIVRPWAEVFP